MTETPAPRPVGIAGERELVLDGIAYRAQLSADGAEYVWDPCWKCGGSGYLTWTSLDESRCWACHTRKGRWVPVRTIERRIKDRARRAANRDKKAQAKRAAVEAQLAQFELDHPGLAFMTGEAVHDETVEMNHIVRDIAMRMQIWGTISEKQLALCEKIVREDDERRAQREVERATASPAPAGRTVIEGVIRSVKMYDGDYGTTYKMLVVTDEGWKAFGTVPAQIEPKTYHGGEDEGSFYGQMMALKGQRVKYTATLEPKADDPIFAIAKRPAKAEIVADVDPIDLQDEASGNMTPGA
jgi:hypothetical protein